MQELFGSGGGVHVQRDGFAAKVLNGQDGLVTGF